MIKSHNDYLLPKNKWVTEALYYHCDIVEVDVILINNEVMLAHGWRPFKCLCKGTLREYMEIAKDKPVKISIEFKEASEKLNEAVYCVLSDYRHKEFIIDAIDRWYAPSRWKYAIKFYNDYYSDLDMVLKPELEAKYKIDTINLYEQGFSYA